MHRISRWSRLTVVALGAAALSLGLAFEWSPGEFPEGDQRYVLELRTGEEAQGVRMVIDIRDVGDGFDVTSTMTFEQAGVGRDELSDAAMGGSMLGMFALGPMVMYGPSFMLLPMLLQGEDIAVRPEPIKVLGLGTLTMDRSEEVAGLDCVVLRLEMDNSSEGALEVALAEGVPFPCYSRYGTGDDAVEVRLIEASP